MMILGHLVGGLALFGGSVLAAAVAVAIAGMAGMQHLRKLLSRASFNVVQLDHGQCTDDVAEPNGSDYTDVVHWIVASTPKFADLTLCGRTAGGRPYRRPSSRAAFSDAAAFAL
jgi:hypothetical protein